MTTYANQEAPGLPAATTLTGAEILHVVQSGNSRRTTAQDFANLLPTADQAATLTGNEVFSFQQGTSRKATALSDISGFTLGSVANLAGAVLPFDGSEVLFIIQGGTKRKITRDNLVSDRDPFGKLPAQNTLLGDATLAMSDLGGMIESNASTQITLTVPADADVPLPVRTVIQLHRYGSGDFAIAPAAGVSIVSASGNRKLATQYGTATLYKRSINEWVLSGALKA